jgi:hypothetical protein
MESTVMFDVVVLCAFAKEDACCDVPASAEAQSVERGRLAMTKPWPMPTMLSNANVGTVYEMI